MNEELLKAAAKLDIDEETLEKEIAYLRSLNPYFTPDRKCPLCKSKAALSINKAYLEQGRDIDIRQFCSMYSYEFERDTKKKLTKRLVENHFENHFNVKAAALQKFNQMKTREQMTTMVPYDNNIQLQVSDELRRVNDLLTDTYVNDLKILDFSVKEQLHHLAEIREVKATRKEAGIGVIDLIMKEEDILRSIQFSLINKIKVFQTGKLQQAKTHVLNSMNFLNASTMHLLGIDEVALSPAIIKKSQDLFVSTVISHFLKRVSLCVGEIQLSSEQKAMFYSKLKKELAGVEDQIYEEFEKNIKDINIINAEIVNEIENDECDDE